MMDVEVERVAVLVVDADETRLIGLVDRTLQRIALRDILAADIDVAGMRTHREGGDQAAFDEKMGIIAHDLAVLAGAGLRLVRVDDEVMRAPVLTAWA